MRNLLLRAGIRGKVIAAFALVLCCTGGLGLSAVQQLSAVNAAAADMRESWLPSVQVFAKIAINAERHRTNVSYHITEDTDVDRTKAESHMQIILDQIA